jgi:hypothetical protein
VPADFAPTHRPLSIGWGDLHFSCVRVLPWAAIDALKRGIDRQDEAALVAFIERAVVPEQRDLFRRATLSSPRGAVVQAAARAIGPLSAVYADRLVDPELARAN